MTATPEDDLAEPKWRRRGPALILGLILLVAAGLRLWSLNHGLPYSYNLDERAHFVPHAVAMTGGDLNPGYFINPPALTYLLAAYFSVIHLGGVEQWFADDPGAVFLAGRLVAVAFGVGAVAATYAAGRAWFDRRAGLVAAAIIAVAFLPVFYSRLALNDGPGVLPCALVLWSSAIVLRTGSLRALLAGGAAVGVAASLKYSDGAVVIALVAAAFLSPELSFKRALGGLAMAGAISLAVVIVTNPYLFADWGTFTHDLDRQRKFADGPPLLGQPERNGWAYYVTSSRWALGIIPGLLAFAGGVLLVVKGRRREALVLGSLVVLYWLYMGSQSRFYARWMLPLYPALAILAAYAVTQIKQRVVFGIVVALALIPSLLHDGPQRTSCSAARTRAPRPATGSWRTSRRAPRWRSSRSPRPSGTGSHPAVGRRRTPPASGSASTAARRSSTSSGATSAARATPRTSRTTSARSAPS